MAFPNRRRVRNFLLGLVLLGLAAWLVPSYFSAERYRHRLEAGLEQALHRRVKFGSVTFRLLPRPGFSIQNVEVDEDPEFGAEPFALVDQVDCDLRWRSLWRARMEFAHLHLDHPNFNVVLNAAGKWNLEKLLVQSGVTTPGLTDSGTGQRIRPEQLDLDADDARINFQIASEMKPFALTDVHGRLQIDPSERRVQFQITASPFRTDMDLPSPGPVEVTGAWAPGADLAGPLEVQLRNPAGLLYDWIPIALGFNPQIYGVMDSTLHVTGSLPNLVVEGDTSVAQLQRWGGPSPSDPTPLVFHYRGRLIRGAERIEVQGIDASFGDSHLHFSGTVASPRGNPHWDCVVSMDRSKLEDVAALVQRFRSQKPGWSPSGRLNAMLTFQGSWAEPHFGGYLGIQQASLTTSSRSYPLSDVSVHIDEKGAVLAPVQVTLAPHVALTVQGVLERSKRASGYDLQVAAKSIPLREAVAFGGGLGIGTLASISASGSISGVAHLTGAVWPFQRPSLAAKAELRAARLLIPGLTEPLNLPHASVQIAGSAIVADPVVAVLGTSVFTGRLEHFGARETPWKFDVRANGLDLEQGSQWFDVLGGRQQVSILQRIPGLASFAARREAASHLFDRLNAQGNFSTPELHYRGVTLKNFSASLTMAGRQIRLPSVKFQLDGGKGVAASSIDFTLTPPAFSVQATLSALSAHSLLDRATAPARELQGALSGQLTLHTRGLSRDELAQNLTGRLQINTENLALGSFDPLGALAETAHWGKLEPVRAPVTVAPAKLSLELSDRRIFLDSTSVDLSGAVLQLDGSYAWSGNLDLNVRADLRRLRRRWAVRDEPGSFADSPTILHLSGNFGHLDISPPDDAVAASKVRGGNIR
jgi:hypothetical protein